MAPGCERPRQVVAGPGGCMQSRCGPCTGACAPSPMPRLLRPVPAFPVFCCPRPVARVPCSAFCVLRSASCVLRPVPPCPCPCPRPRPRPRVPRFASCAPRPRLPCSAPAPRTPHPRLLRPVPVPPSSAPRTPRPCPWLRLLRPADGCPRSAPCLPPPHFGAGPFGFCKPQG